MTRERLIPLLFVAAFVLDYLYPIIAPGTVTGAWLIPALMGLGALSGAIRGKREGKNNAAAERYKAERQNAVDRYEASLSKAKRGERLRFGNALARSRGFVVPEFDAAASEGVNLGLPAIPEYKSGGFLETAGDVAGGVAGGMTTEARLNTERGSLPEGAGEEAGPPTSMIEGGPLPSAVPTASSVSDYAATTPYTPFDANAPSGQRDPYASLLSGTRYFSTLQPRR